MAKDYDEDTLKGLNDFNLFDDDDDLFLLDTESEDDSGDGDDLEDTASARRGKGKKNRRVVNDYSGGKVMRSVLVILIVLVVAIAAVLFVLQMTRGNLSNLMFWRWETQQTEESLPGESLPVESDAVVETEPAAETTEPVEETTSAVTEEPESSAETTATGLGDELALMQTVPATFELELVGVDNLGNVQEDGSHQVDATVAEALEEFIAAARAQGYNTMLSTCYYEDVSSNDELDVQEHATGLAVDLVDVDAQVKAVFAEECTEEIRWLTENAADYGFILRFPEGKEDITGMEYIPYHFAYVGETVAKEMAENDWCLEEYLAQ